MAAPRFTWKYNATWRKNVGRSKRAPGYTLEVKGPSQPWDSDGWTACVHRGKTRVECRYGLGSDLQARRAARRLFDKHRRK